MPANAGPGPSSLRNTTNNNANAELARIDKAKKVHYMVGNMTKMPNNPHEFDIVHMKLGESEAGDPKAETQTGLLFKDLKDNEKYKILQQITACILNSVYSATGQPIPRQSDSPIYKDDQRYNVIREEVLKKIHKNPDIIVLKRQDKGHYKKRQQFTIGIQHQPRGNMCDYYYTHFCELLKNI